MSRALAFLLRALAFLLRALVVAAAFLLLAAALAAGPFAAGLAVVVVVAVADAVLTHAGEGPRT